MLSEIVVTAGIKQQVQVAAVVDPGSKTLCRRTCKGDGVSQLQQRKYCTGHWQQRPQSACRLRERQEGAQCVMVEPQQGTDLESSATRLSPKTGKSAIDCKGYGC